METSAFQALLTQLDSLTPVQRDALTELLECDGSNNEAIALLEARFDVAPACGHCGSDKFGKWGRASGMRRYRCNECNRTFNALTGTPLAHLRRRDAWLSYARALVDGDSLREAARRANICLDSSFRWRHRMLATSASRRAPASPRPFNKQGSYTLAEQSRVNERLPWSDKWRLL